MDFNAVDVLMPEEVAKLPPNTKIIGTSWVHADKKAKLRTSAAVCVPVLTKEVMTLSGCSSVAVSVTVLINKVMHLCSCCPAVVSVAVLDKTVMILCICLSVVVSVIILNKKIIFEWLLL